jgi:hypothetical protein
MGAVVTLEQEPMTDQTSTTESTAAREAVRDIPRKIIALGGTKEQAYAMAEAMRLVLDGHQKEARLILQKGGYPQDVIEATVNPLAKRSKSAA